MADQQEAATPELLADDTSVVSIRDLRVEFRTALGMVSALSGVSFDVPRGRVLGVVGESGCGKSVTARAILRIIEKSGRITGGQVLFRPGRGDEAIDLTALDPAGDEIRSIRGDEISMIFQEPMTSLNPVYTIGNQIAEAILLHQTSDRVEARTRTLETLRRVGMPNAERVADSYPHEMSGGMRQRAMIAMALSCRPTLLIADEPTTALDVTTEAQILELLRELQDESSMSILFITHSMGVVAQLCDDVVIMYLGRVVERAPVDEIFYNPKHPYTVALLQSIPRIGANRGRQLKVISGSVPDPYSTVGGCPFHPRCESAMAGLCDTVVPIETGVADAEDHTVRCHLYPGSTPEEAADSLEARRE